MKLVKGAVYIGVLILGLTGCTKLGVKPTDTIDPGKAYRNVSDINLGLIGAYALGDYGPVSLNVIAGDEAAFPVENTVGNNEAYRWLYTPSSGSVTSTYDSYYTGIDRINRVLEALDKIAISDGDRAVANKYKAEALALRAYYHFELLRAYAEKYETGAMGVPYMKAVAVGYPARDNFEIVIANAKADLEAARQLMPAGLTDKTRLSLPAIAALEARIALYEKNWADAIKFATEVINTVPLANKTQFPGIWTDANDTEVIWKLKRVGTTDSRIGDFFYRQTGGIALYTPAQKLINAFSNRSNDLRYASYIKFDATRTGTKSQYLVNKYAGTAAAPGLADIKVFRTAEMYLIRAEAEAESTGDAAGDINTLRNNRINGYANETFAGKAALIDAIYNERYKELAFEGHRFYDLKRRNYSVNRLAADAANANNAVTLLPTQPQYSFPIPAQEILINKNTKQNPGY